MPGNPPRISFIPPLWYLLRLDPRLVERFKAHVAFPDDPCGHDCWEWTGAKIDGYGQFGARYFSRAEMRPRLAHRIALIIQGEKFLNASWAQVRHQCHNRSCVNPAHLLLGNAGDNNRDRQFVAPIIRVMGLPPRFIRVLPFKLSPAWEFPACAEHYDQRWAELRRFHAECLADEQ